ALHQYRAGVRWWLEDPDVIKDAVDQQQARYDADAWQGLIQWWLRIRMDTCIEEVLSQCVEKPKDQWTQADKEGRGALPAHARMGTVPAERRQRFGLEISPWRIIRRIYSMFHVCSMSVPRLEAA